MPPYIEELDYRQTDLGELILRRRRAVEVDGREIFEVQLNEEFLMTSLFHAGETALTDLGLAELTGDRWDIVVGGLGLGYSAVAALNHAQVERLIVVEALEPVIDWHQRELVPNGPRLSQDRRCLYYNADFFALARGKGFDRDDPGHRFDAILLDIDHTPVALLNPSHADLYSVAGMQRIHAFLKPGGVFGLWSNDAPDQGFIATLSGVFEKVTGHVVEFKNPIQGKTAVNGIYVASVSSTEVSHGHTRSHPATVDLALAKA
jgi:spermidine synthase